MKTLVTTVMMSVVAAVPVAAQSFDSSHLRGTWRCAYTSDSYEAQETVEYHQSGMSRSRFTSIFEWDGIDMAFTAVATGPWTLRGDQLRNENSTFQLESITVAGVTFRPEGRNRDIARALPEPQRSTTITLSVLDRELYGGSVGMAPDEVQVVCKRDFSQ
ncbi:MAG: hypothetical protein AAGF45_10470 [Pseudomonadota bacterium]